MDTRCIVCREDAPDGKIIGFHRVCRNCFREYCQTEPVIEDFSPDFLEAQGADYYLHWWWEGDAYLSEKEKLQAVKELYRRREQQYPEEMKQVRKEYLREVFPEWEDFLLLGKLPEKNRA